METATASLNSEGLQVVRLERGRLPGAGAQHLWRQLCRSLCDGGSEVGSRSYLVVFLVYLENLDISKF